VATDSVHSQSLIILKLSSSLLRW